MGTICISNLSGFSNICMPDDELRQLGDRGFVEYFVTFEGCEEPGIRLIRWNDGKIFNFAHTFSSGHPTVKAERWYRDLARTKVKSEVEMPVAVAQYNRCMGGIDKMDSCTAMYPCKFKVRRWHMKVFFHLIDITTVNAWLLYIIDHDRTFPGEKHLTLYQFKRLVSEVWMKQNSIISPRRLCSMDRRSTPVPRTIRFDGKEHWPVVFLGYKKRNRCALCDRDTNMYCIKCEVFL